MSSSLMFILVLFISFLATIPSSSEALDDSVKEITHMHLYFHEITAGPNRTTSIVAPTNSSLYGFGGVVAIDDELREGPEPTSKLIGRAQGILPRVSKEEIASLVAANFVFTEGKYNGSTLDVFGRAVLASDRREWSIIGGSGQFRLARGYVLGKKLSSPAGSLLIELDIYVLHNKNKMVCIHHYCVHSE